VIGPQHGPEHVAQRAVSEHRIVVMAALTKLDVKYCASAGDICEVQIEKVGVLRNPIVKEKG
jgi:hypothetical protein